jgi:acetylornithine/N-succinyldiaminopimelate aminotransferase
VRGLGLLVGVALDRDAKGLQKTLRERHRILVGGSSDPEVVRLFPPVTIDEADLDRGAQAFAEALKSS